MKKLLLGLILVSFLFSQQAWRKMYKNQKVRSEADSTEFMGHTEFKGEVKFKPGWLEIDQMMPLTNDSLSSSWGWWNNPYGLGFLINQYVDTIQSFSSGEQVVLKDVEVIDDFKSSALFNCFVPETGDTIWIDTTGLTVTSGGWRLLHVGADSQIIIGAHVFVVDNAGIYLDNTSEICNRDEGEIYYIRVQNLSGSAGELIFKRTDNISNYDMAKINSKNPAWIWLASDSGATKLYRNWGEFADSVKTAKSIANKLAVDTITHVVGAEDLYFRANESGKELYFEDWYSMYINNRTFITAEVQYSGSAFRMLQNAELEFGNNSNSELVHSSYQASSTDGGLLWGFAVHNYIAFCDKSYTAEMDFDHGNQTNPTIFIHSDVSPDVDETQWISFKHDQTDGVIAVGKGNIKLDADVEVTGDINTVPWTDYAGTSTIVGWAATPTANIYYKKVGNLVYVNFHIQGTSNANNATFTLPYTNVNMTNANVNTAILAFDNTVALATPGAAYLTANAATVTCEPDWSGQTSWTPTGLKVVAGQFFYEAQ